MEWKWKRKKKNISVGKRPKCHNRYNSNLFRTKPTGFNIEQENFPSLAPTPTPTPTSTPTPAHYLNITQSINKTVKDTSYLSKGWIILHNQKYNQKKFIPIKSANNTENNTLFKPPRYCAQLIFENRQRYREELNEILGDISPYWNSQYEDNDSDDNYSDDEGVYTDEEEYILDEW